jgi:hypothetical protein
VFPGPKTQAAIYPSPVDNVAAVPIDPRHTGPRRDVARLTRVEVVTEVAWLEILARLGTIFAYKELQEVSFDAVAAR